MNPNDIRAVIITDCGSTTTKALLIEKVDGIYRQTARGDAATTVEEPHLDITVGVKAAIRTIEAICGRPLLDDTGELIRPYSAGKGVDLYLSTSSAGGGLQIAVAGVVRKLSTKAAERAALGAGAIVSQVIACDDDTPLHAQIEALRSGRPDMMLIAGGTDDGAFYPVVEIAEMLAAAAPRTRLGKGFQLPVIFAGNRAAAQAVRDALPDNTPVFVEDNVMGTVDTENLSAARERVHSLFLEHVMQQAPGFGRLAALTDTPVMPTPSSAADMLSLCYEARRENTLLVDIGGATTDIFSMVEGVMTRTVSANLGMSYSAARVLIEAGTDGMRKGLPFEVDDDRLWDLVMNKTVRPTTIPDSVEELLLEQGLAREALRLGLVHHALFAGNDRATSGMDAFRRAGGSGGFSMMGIDRIIGSGGVISHAPTAAHAAMMLLDGFLPRGITRLVRDVVFMMPHLGLLSRIHKEAALSVFDLDCIEELGVAVAPVGQAGWGKPCLRYRVIENARAPVEGTLSVGEICRVNLAPKSEAQLVLMPGRGFDVGAGIGRTLERTVRGAPLGIIFDGRGRPWATPPEPLGRQAVRSWFEALGIPVDPQVSR